MIQRRRKISDKINLITVFITIQYTQFLECERDLCDVVVGDARVDEVISLSSGTKP